MTGERSPPSPLAERGFFCTVPSHHPFKRTACGHIVPMPPSWAMTNSFQARRKDVRDAKSQERNLRSQKKVRTEKGEKSDITAMGGSTVCRPLLSIRKKGKI